MKVDEAKVEEVVGRIRNATYPSVAARQSGVPAGVWQEWMKDESVSVRVRQAQTHAMAEAEAEVKRTNPEAWIKYGPARHGSSASA